MIEVLCRGKEERSSGKLGDWVYGVPIPVQHNTHPTNFIELVSCVNYDELDNGWPDFSSIPIASETLGRYTGLLDANKQRIFEGDILQFGVHKLIVYWDEESFQWAAKKKRGYDVIHFRHHYPRDYWDSIDLGEIAAEEVITGRMTTVVIGNIFDNADLIEDSTDDSDFDSNWEF